MTIYSPIHERIGDCIFYYISEKEHNKDFLGSVRTQLK